METTQKKRTKKERLGGGNVKKKKKREDHNKMRKENKDPRRLKVDSLKQGWNLELFQGVEEREIKDLGEL